MASPFWREFSFPSPVDDILRKPNFTLEELLDEDDVVVDTRSQKEDLKEFLTRKETLVKLLKYVVAEQPPEATEAARMRYPVVVCEILTSEVDDIERELIKNEDLLIMLFDFFNTPNVNLLLANLVAKIIGTLLNNKLPFMIAFLKKSPQLMSTLLNQINCSITTDLLVRLIGAESEYDGKGIQQWLVEIGFVTELLSKFDVSKPALHPDVSNSICELLSCLPHVALFKAFLERKNLNILLGHCFEPGNSTGLRWGLAVFHHILRSITVETGGAVDGQAVLATSPLDALQPALQLGIENLSKFQQLLIAPPNTKSITNQNGAELEAFGFHRLLVVQCIDALVNSGFNVILQTVASQFDLMTTIVSLFTVFPTNNFCHRFAEHLLMTVIANLQGETLVQFLEKSKILTMLVEADKVNKEKTDLNGPRAQHMPFIYSLGAAIQEKGTLDETVGKIVGGVENWQVLVAAILDDRQKSEQTLGPYDDNTDSEEPYNPSLSEDDNDLESDEPNDADDYDTDQAEILLSKAEIEAM